MMRHRWVFVTFVALWVLLVVLSILNVIRHFRDHVHFDSTFWVGPVALVVMTATLVRANRFRRNAQSAAASDKSRH